MKKVFFSKLLLFVVGMCVYTTIEVLFRGYSYRLMSLVGGISLLILDAINDRVSWTIPLVIQMVIGGIAITILELISGEFGLHVLGIRMWDYSNQWMPLCDNFICPLFSFFWVLLSGVGIILADAINYYVLHSEMRPIYLKLNGDGWFMLPERLCGHKEGGVS